MSSKPLGKPGMERKNSLDITTDMPDAESVDAAKVHQHVVHEVKERRNGYKKISTDVYYRTERRALHESDDSGVQGSQENEGEVVVTPYSEEKI